MITAESVCVKRGRALSVQSGRFNLSWLQASNDNINTIHQRRRGNTEHLTFQEKCLEKAGFCSVY